jgi:hypothetical protein
MLFALPGHQFPYIVMNRCFYVPLSDWVLLDKIEVFTQFKVEINQVKRIFMPVPKIVKEMAMASIWIS